LSWKNETNLQFLPGTACFKPLLSADIFIPAALPLSTDLSIDTSIFVKQAFLPEKWGFQASIKTL